MKAVEEKCAGARHVIDILWPKYITRWPDSPEDAANQAVKLIIELSDGLHEEGQLRRKAESELARLKLGFGPSTPIAKHLAFVAGVRAGTEK
jgi:hypothetical protein